MPVAGSNGEGATLTVDVKTEKSRIQVFGNTTTRFDRYLRASRDAWYKELDVDRNYREIFGTKPPRNSLSESLKIYDLRGTIRLEEGSIFRSRLYFANELEDE